MSSWDTIHCACSASVVVSAFCESKIQENRRMDSSWVGATLWQAERWILRDGWPMLTMLWPRNCPSFAKTSVENQDVEGMSWLCGAWVPTGRSFAELSYLHEDLLLAMTEQVVSTVLLGRLGFCGASKKGPVAWQCFSFRQDTNQRCRIWGFRLLCDSWVILCVGVIQSAMNIYERFKIQSGLIYRKCLDLTWRV